MKWTAPLEASGARTASAVSVSLSRLNLDHLDIAALLRGGGGRLRSVNPIQKGSGQIRARPAAAPCLSARAGARTRNVTENVMALKVELKPHERIIIGSCVITNTDQRARLLIDGDNDSDPAREGHPDAGDRRHAGQADLSGGAADVYFAGPAGQSRHLLQPGARHRHRRAERVADHRGHQQQHPERRSVSGAEGSQEARSPTRRSCWISTTAISRHVRLSRRSSSVRLSDGSRPGVPSLLTSPAAATLDLAQAGSRDRCAPNSSTAATSASISQMSVR